MGHFAVLQPGEKRPARTNKLKPRRARDTMVAALRQGMLHGCLQPLASVVCFISAQYFSNMAAEHKNSLEALKATGTVVVSDSGELDKIRALRPHDATTNPSLILAASRLPEYKHVVDDAVAFGKTSGKQGTELMELVLDKVRG
jgi:hypothetical protein